MNKSFEKQFRALDLPLNTDKSNIQLFRVGKPGRKSAGSISSTTKSNVFSRTRYNIIYSLFLVYGPILTKFMKARLMG